jgi:hypothetical protein
VRRIKYSCKQQLLLRRRRNGKDGGMEVSLGCGDELRVNKHLARCVCACIRKVLKGKNSNYLAPTA